MGFFHKGVVSISVGSDGKDAVKYTSTIQDLTIDETKHIHLPTWFWTHSCCPVQDFLRFSLAPKFSSQQTCMTGCGPPHTMCPDWNKPALSTHSLSSTHLDQHHHLFGEEHTFKTWHHLLFWILTSLQHSSTHVIPERWAGTCHAICKYNTVEEYRKVYFQIELFATIK